VVPNAAQRLEAHRNKPMLLPPVHTGIQQWNLRNPHIDVIFTETRESMKRRPTIILNSFDQPVLHGIPVDVINTSLQIVIV
jgi:hypothetical protein